MVLVLKLSSNFLKMITVLNTDLSMLKERNTPNGFMDARLFARNVKVDITLTRHSLVLLYLNTVLLLMFMESVQLVLQDIK